MKKRNDYISDKLIYSGDRLKSQMMAAEANLETANHPAPTVAEQAAPVPPPPPPKVLIERKQFEEYSRVRREQMLRLSEFSALLEAELSDSRQLVAEAEKLQILFDQFFQEINQLPETYDQVNEEPEKFNEFNRNLEQARLVIVRHAAAVRKLLAYETGGGKHHNSSIVHEVASLTFLQLIRVGIGTAFPLILAIILAALIIGGAIVLTMGGV